MKTITLTMSPDYVKHWGLWEACRELLQNALDAKTKGHTMKVYDHPEGCGLMIENTGPGLSRSALLLGKTTKEGDASQIGQFGEGFKLALLVLCRLGHNPTMVTGNEVWRPKIAHSDEFDCDLLMIDVTTCEEDDIEPFEGVQIILESVQLEDLKGQYKPDMPLNKPIRDPELLGDAGDMYVNGLFICKAKGFQYDYNFSPERIKLDRDRGMIEGFELCYETGRIWNACVDEMGGDTLLKLINDKAPDVEGLSYHVSGASGTALYLHSSYTNLYGSAIPVSTQAEVNKAMAAGKKWQLVPDALKTILWRVAGYFIPSIGTPAQRLAAFIDQRKYTLDQQSLAELKDILSALEGGTRLGKTNLLSS